VKQTIRFITKRNRGISLDKVIAELNIKFTGWVNYFKLSESPSLFEKLDSWIRRKLRCYRIKQRKRCYLIVRFLMELGVPACSAWSTGLSEKGWWRLSISPAVHQALSNVWFKKQGLINLYQKATAVKV
jgi:RNA-directed DNA polymerase